MHGVRFLTRWDQKEEEEEVVDSFWMRRLRGWWQLKSRDSSVPALAVSAREEREVS